MIWTSVAFDDAEQLKILSIFQRVLLTISSNGTRPRKPRFLKMDRNVLWLLFIVLIAIAAFLFALDQYGVVHLDLPL